MKKTNRQQFFALVWNASEFAGIGLGRLAPHVFSEMIGCKKYKKVNPNK